MAVAAVILPRARRLAPIVILLALASLLFFAPFGFHWPCPVQSMFGVPCPSCGMTRAARFAAHGDFAAATHVHPMWFLLLPFLALVIGLELAQYVRTGQWGGAGKIPGVRTIGYVIVTLLFVVWIARFFGAFGGPCPPG